MQNATRKCEETKFLAQRGFASLDFQNIRKKIAQIIENPEHYKPLRGTMKGQREVHLNTHFILTFEIQGSRVVFLDYAHKDEVYE